MPHPLNFTAGWWLILAAFVSGAVIGMGFHREDFRGGRGTNCPADKFLRRPSDEY
jgi:hypothetical protein